jgi:hypothetical protein
MRPPAWIAVCASLVISASAANASRIGYYTFNNSTLQESSGNSNNGIPATDAPTFVSGIGGDSSIATQFNGALNQFFTLPINLNNYSGYTFGAWVYIPTAPAAPPFRGIISADAPGFQATIDIDTRAGSAGYSAFAGNFGSPKQVIGGVAVTPGTWEFLAVSYDNVADTVLFDVNGAMFSGNTGFNVAARSTITVGRNPCCDQPLTGYMDNVFVDNTAMNAAQLSNLQTSTSLTTTPEPGTMALLLLGAIFLTFLSGGARSRPSLSTFRKRWAGTRPKEQRFFSSGLSTAGSSISAECRSV